MNGTWTNRGARVAGALLGAAALVVGCRGAVDRTYFDDEDDVIANADASQLDGTANADGTTSTDGGSDAGDGGDAAKTPDAADAGPTHAIGGTVVGLAGTGLVLRLNGGSDLVVAPSDAGGNVGFTFPKQIAEGSSFAVTIKTQPSSPSQTCNVSGGSGTVGGGDVTAVVVNCLKDAFTVGGSISGLEGTITLDNNGAETLPLNANGTFAFPTPLESGKGYAVTMASHSALPVQDCVVSNGSGTVASGNITSVGVACTTKSYSLGGTASGIVGGNLVIANAGTPLVVSADGPFTFGSKVLSNRAYDVQVVTAPPNRICPITNGKGTVTNADVSDVTVTCVPQYVLTENFDGVTAPALPTGWSTAVLYNAFGNPSPFATTSTATATTPALPAAHTTPNSCYVANAAAVSDIVLTSPAFTVDTSNATLTFRHAYSLEASADPSIGYDGVMLEITTDGGTTWTDIEVAGGTWVSGGYDRPLSSQWDNPLGGRKAWTGTSPGLPGWRTTTVKLPLTAGQTAQIRFRLGTDKRNYVAPYVGWRVDTIVVAN